MTKMRSIWLLPLVLTILLVGCGSDEGGAAEPVDEVEVDMVATDSRVLARDGLLSTDDLVSLGFKSGKEYDVSTLPGGVEAGLLYWRVNDIAVEYEARFYGSHDDAVALGTAPAEERSGEDAIIDVDDAVYKEGIRDRRKIFRYPNAVLKPKYGAFGIYGNMVVLCEGKDDAEAWNRCSALFEALDNR